MHTTASDGEYAPSALVHMAYQAGLEAIAITDHDTLEGIEVAQRTGAELGIEVLSGVELSTKYGPKSIDILGYELSINPELERVLAHMRAGREERAIHIIEKFVQLGMPITMEDVKEFSRGNVLARPHIAQAIVKKGYVSDVRKVFDHYLGDGKPCAVNKVVLSPEEGIALIHRAGGKAVLAHPVLINDDNLVRKLLSAYDFDGLEVWHREQDQQDNKRYKKLAQEYKLIMTGGSDFHNDTHQLGKFGLHK